MILTLLLSLAAPALQADDPPVSIRLNHEHFLRGDRARVYVETAGDGHLLVLHADPDGRVRVLFPVDPGDDDFVRGGRRVEVRSRGDRDAFFVSADDGAGTVLAAFSLEPFRYEAFVRGDHWDYRVLGATRLTDDPLAGLLDLASRMAGESQYEYDAVTYVVGRGVVSRYGYIQPRLHFGYGYPYGFRFGFFYGYPYRYGYYPFYDAFYDPYCYDPFWGWGAFCPRYGFLYSSVGFYRPYGYRRSFIGGSFYRPVSVRPPLAMPRDRSPVTVIEPRRRVPAGGVFREARSTRDRIQRVEPRTRLVVPRERAVEPHRVAAPRGRVSARARPAAGVREGRVAPRGGREFRPSNGGGRRPAISRGSAGGSRGGMGGSRPVSRPVGPRRR